MFECENCKEVVKREELLWNKEEGYGEYPKCPYCGNTEIHEVELCECCKENTLDVDDSIIDNKCVKHYVCDKCRCDLVNELSLIIDSKFSKEEKAILKAMYEDTPDLDKIFD